MNRLISVRILLSLCWGAVLSGAGAASAQHCAPIEESYLGAIQVRHDPEKKALDFAIDYCKLGGRAHPAYQIYLVGFWSRDRERLLQAPEGKAFNPEAGIVLHTEVVRREELPGGKLEYGCRYPLRVSFDETQLAAKMIGFGQPGPDDREVVGGWGRFRDDFHIAVFVPFLEDAEYSTLEGLPEDRHECNYTGDPALLFEVLPQAFNIRFGVVSAFRQEEGRFRVQVNQSRRWPERAKE